MKDIDVNKMRSYLSSLNLRNIDERYSIFYDETNNFRKLRLLNGRINIEKNTNFVIGGIALPFGVSIDSIDDLRSMLRLQSSAQELKIKHIANGDYLSLIASERMSLFLEWVLGKEIYIHYAVLDALYWSLIDIIESLMGEDWFHEFIPYHAQIKTELYDIVIRDLSGFLILLDGFSYPNVDRTRVGEFYSSVLKFVLNTSPKDRNYCTEILRWILQQAATSSKEAVFLHENNPGELIGSFSDFFLRTLYVFKNSSHHFDEEKQVAAILKEFCIKDGDKNIEYEFINSQSNVCIQIADVVSGLFGKYFDYVMSNSMERIDADKGRLSSVQTKNLELMRRLVDRSDDESNAFFNMVVPLDTSFKSNVFLHGVSGRKLKKLLGYRYFTDAAK